MSKHNDPLIDDPIEIMIVLSVVWGLGIGALNVLQWVGVL